MSLSKLFADVELERRNNANLGERLLGKIDVHLSQVDAMRESLEQMKAGVAKEVAERDLALLRIIEGEQPESPAP